jgi:hypothetical protein
MAGSVLDNDVAELAGIARDYPAWHVWRSQAGRWWATRLGHVRPPGDRDGEYALTLDADTAGELRAALAGQDDPVTY